MRSAIEMFPRQEKLSEADGPQYLALRDHIALNIEIGRLLPGSRLPSERQFQSEAGIARGTIRQALSQLEAEGLIYRRDRSGWYVSPPAITYDPMRWAGFMAYVAEQGRVPATTTLEKSIRPATAALADIFRVAPGASLYEIRRRRMIDGRSVLVERITVDPALAPDLLSHSLDGSLTDILKSEYGVTVARNRVDMRPCALVRDAAEALGVHSGTPGLLVVRTSFDASGRVVEYDQEYWRHDAIRVHVDLTVREETIPPK
ncbi:UTRA domain-containing protein [Altererythrobacter xixiisoli]|uniref:UTRA domain-containing protein n=1 Tax=Croceibacterium xixiisoli TaxID=1476466 RepID=A0A6I4TX76_9SPHN|nr:UTRA domain-containing protein [Croceibacterium xixiisoli]MXP00605.1 UTRA domain-containing protein [Croceibacterium xixiisoli]